MKQLITAIVACLLFGCSDMQHVTVTDRVPVTSEPNGLGTPHTIVLVRTDDGRRFFDIRDLPIGYQFDMDISRCDEVSDEEYVEIVGIAFVELGEVKGE